MAYGHATRSLISQRNPNWRSPLTPQNSGGNTHHLYRTTCSLLPTPCSVKKKQEARGKSYAIANLPAKPQLEIPPNPPKQRGEHLPPLPHHLLPAPCSLLPAPSKKFVTKF
ncbi:MAG: hypothetical protein F6K55_10990 [Moorea sp. SIO4A3]|nr:hypothetical protein [Moorena sp. SIO4A3]